MEGGLNFLASGRGDLDFFGLRQGGVGLILDAEKYKPPANQSVNSEPSLDDGHWSFPKLFFYHSRVELESISDQMTDIARLRFIFDIVWLFGWI